MTQVVLKPEATVKTEIIDGKKHIYLYRDYYKNEIKKDGAYVFESVSPDEIDFENDEWEITFTPSEKGWATHVMVDDVIKPNPHKVDLSWMVDEGLIASELSVVKKANNHERWKELYDKYSKRYPHLFKDKI